jgi:hypothetical protein
MDVYRDLVGVFVRFSCAASPGVDEFQILNNHAAVVSFSKRDCSITAPSFEFDKATARLIY